MGHSSWSTWVESCTSFRDVKEGRRVSYSSRRWCMSVESVVCLFFFFSSRRRHTRYIGDWSDVCSSDLSLPMTSRKPAVLAGILLFQEEAGPLDPPFWRHICGTLFGLRSTIIYLAILFEKVRNRQCLCGFSACLRGIAKSYGAVERTRTSTVLLPPAPQAGASASSATTAQWVGIILAIEC